MDECIFCKIVKGEIPAYKVYEDEGVFGFLDVNPISKGHCLVIPKKHYSSVFDIPSEELEKVISAVKIISEKINEKLDATGVNLINASGKDAQQSVFHFHMHIIPRCKGDGIDAWPKSEYSEKDFNKVIKKFLAK